ncbi:signal peptidase I [Amycolatopsis minnesotensis]|uniref:Signal peptidase I n=1 Tax=Amycolatopsis minnesotensis TaxID=337894 RepID=A0ABN2RW82_9PSEU
MTESDFPPPPPSVPRRRFSRRLALALVLAAAGLVVGLVGVIKVLGYRTFDDDRTEMAATMPVSGKAIVSPVSPTALHRGDIIVFDMSAYPGGKNSGSTMKRVIGVGGDTVACCDAGTRLTVNGEAVTEDYIRPAGYADREFSVKVPDGTVFAAGDQRDDSRDSRTYVTAPGSGGIPLDKVTGVVVGAGNIFSAQALDPTRAFTDAGLPGVPLRDTGYRTGSWFLIGGLAVFVVALIAAIVLRSTGRRRTAGEDPPAR